MTKTATAAIAAVQAAATPRWTGVPTRLVRKTTLVEGEATPEALASDATSSLPVRTLTFEIPPAEDGDFAGKARPHSEIRMELGDVVKMVIPGHKPKSYSVSAMRPGEFDVTFKVYPNGRASGYLDRLEVGSCANSFGLCKGKKRRPPRDGGIVGLIAYGVGITEAWPIAKAELDGRVDGDGDGESRVVLLWASRTRADTFWNDEMEEYERRHAGRLEVVRIFSREDVEGSLPRGRIDRGVLSRVFEEGREGEPRFLSVGTKSMMAMTDRMLTDVGFPMPQHALLA